jgi:hypothetical protein
MRLERRNESDIQILFMLILIDMSDRFINIIGEHCCFDRGAINSDMNLLKRLFGNFPK